MGFIPMATFQMFTFFPVFTCVTMDQLLLSSKFQSILVTNDGDIHRQALIDLDRQQDDHQLRISIQRFDKKRVYK